MLHIAERAHPAGSAHCFAAAVGGKVPGRNVTVPFALLALFAFWLTGCAVGPNFVRPKPPSVTQYTSEAQPSGTVSAAGQTQHFQMTAEIAADWWRLFGSTTSVIFNLFTATATVSYALDVFGGLRRSVESQQAQVDYQRYEVLATYITLLGNVVNTFVAQAAYRAEIEATKQIIGLTQNQLEITEAQAQAGIAPYANVLSIQTQLASFEASLPALEQNLSQAQHLLATLVGLTPAEWTPPLLDLADLKLPEQLPLSLPSELVRQLPADRSQCFSAGCGRPAGAGT